MSSSFKKTLEWIDNHFPYMVTPILNLGQPKKSRDVVTAAVSFDDDGTVQLMVHEPFFEKNTDAENTGVLFHELNHIALGHLHEFDKFENNQARIIAQECIVNDTVIQEGAELPDVGLHYGKDWVGYDCAYLPTKVVYDDLMKDPDKLPQEIQVSCSHGNGDPSDGSAPSQGAIMNQIFKDADLSEASSGLKDAIENSSSKAGTEFDVAKMLGNKKISLAWPTLINKIHPHTFNLTGKGKTKSTWVHQRRNLMGARKRIMLPAPTPGNENGRGLGKKKTLVLALDCSGSVPYEKREELLSLAQSIPKNKLEVHVCTFSTYHVPFDINKSADQDVAQGGTDFSAVVEFVNTLKLPEKPKVVVATDGDANFGRERPGDLDANWHWLIFGRSTPGVYDSSVTENLYDYAEYITQ